VVSGNDGQPGVTRVRNPIAYHGAFRDLVSHPKLLDLVETLIGPDIQFVHSKINLKPPCNERAAYPWHQDWPFNLHTNFDMLAAMSPLDDATEQNGCLRVIPGSHKLGLVDHRYGRSFGVQEEELVEDNSHQVSLVVPAGGVTLHLCCLLHSSAENHDTAMRNAILFDYRAADNVQLGGAVGPSRGLLVRGKDPLSVRMMAGTFKIRDAPGLPS
jgi:phytanoyl-CoA hydroxylase